MMPEKTYDLAILRQPDWLPLRALARAVPREAARALFTRSLALAVSIYVVSCETVSVIIDKIKNKNFV